jgi:F-type H+-transporting ATPase subunit alpha
MPVQEQVIVIYAGVRGHIDNVPVEDVQRFESELRAFMRAGHADMLEQIATTGTLPKEGDLEAAIAEFKRGFGSSGPASPAAPGNPPAAEVAAEADVSAQSADETGAE